MMAPSWKASRCLLLHLLLVLATTHLCLAEDRTLDGQGNNVDHTLWGSSSQPMAFVLASPAFGDNISSPAGASRPSARNISNTLFTTAFMFDTADVNDILPYFGQFLAHDMLLNPNDEHLPLNIPVPRCDEHKDQYCFGNQSIPFIRSLGGIVDGVRVGTNLASHWIDASQVYGYTSDRLAKLRSGQGGKLLVSEGPNGPLLPLNTMGQEMDGGTGPHLFAAGDPRANLNLPLLSLHTLFHLEHNKRAEEIISDPAWEYGNDDELIFQAARRYVIALVQKIAWKDYLPRVIGRTLPEYPGYDPTVNPVVDVSFTTTAFRYGHSGSNNFVYRVDENRRIITEGHLPVHDSIFNPTEFRTNGLDNVLRGIVMQPEAATDTNYVDGLRNNLKLHDLAAVDIQRGRDRGVASYNDLRQAYGMDRVNNFAEITTDTQVQDIMAHLYGSVDNIDGLVGGLAERPLATGGIVSNLFADMIEEQFVRLRDGDRFYYENVGVLSDAEMAAVSSRTLSKMILDHTNIQWFPTDAFGVQTGSDCTHDEGDTVPAPSNDGSFYSFEPMTGLELRWRIVDNVKIELEVDIDSATGEGWAGVGFGTSTMAGRDVAMMRLDGAGNAVIEDCTSFASSLPVTDTSLGRSNDIIDSSVSAEFANGKLTFKFSRLLNTGDNGDHVIITDGNTPIIAARGTSKVPSYHGASGRVAFQLNLSDDSSDKLFANTNSRISLLISHGGTMTLVWLGMYPMGGIIARYFSNKVWWVAWHQSTTQSGTLAVAMFALSAFATGSGQHFQNWHSIIGIALVGCLCVQISVGWVLRFIFNHGDYRIILRFKRVHQYLGRSMILFAPVNVYMGMGLVWPNYNLPFYILYVYLALLTVLGIVLEIMKRHRVFCIPLMCCWRGSKSVTPEQQKQSQKYSETTTGETAAHPRGQLGAKTMSWKEINQRVNAGAELIVIGGCVYDIKAYLPAHPGGAEVVRSMFGVDATKAFFGNGWHKHSIRAAESLKGLFFAYLEDDSGEEGAKSISQHRFSPHRITAIAKNEHRPNEVIFTIEVRDATDGPRVGAGHDKNVNMFLSPGHHVVVQKLVKGYPVQRPYTPIDDLSVGLAHFKLLIKLYPDGEMSQQLSRARVGDILRVCAPLGNSILNPNHKVGFWSFIGMFAAGSGLTPMIPLIKHHIHAQKTKMVLMFYNRDESDVFGKEILDELVEKCKGKLNVIYAYTNPKNAFDNAAVTGRIDQAAIDQMGLPSILSTGDNERVRKNSAFSRRLPSHSHPHNIRRVSSGMNRVHESVTNFRVPRMKSDENESVASLDINDAQAQHHATDTKTTGAPDEVLITDGGGAAEQGAAADRGGNDEEGSDISPLISAGRQKCFTAKQTIFVVCGPIGFERATVSLLQEMGYDDDVIKVCDDDVVQ